MSHGCCACLQAGPLPSTVAGPVACRAGAWRLQIPAPPPNPTLPHAPHRPPGLACQAQRRRGAAADPVSEDDLARAIERLAGLGSGFGLVTIGGKQFVRSVPTELSTDSNSLIELAEVGARALPAGPAPAVGPPAVCRLMRLLRALFLWRRAPAPPVDRARRALLVGSSSSCRLDWFRSVLPVLLKHVVSACLALPLRVPQFCRFSGARLNCLVPPHPLPPPTPPCTPPIPTPIPTLQRLGGYFSLADALGNTGWQEERLRDALAAMAREGLLLIDDQPGKQPRRQQKWHGREWRPGCPVAEACARACGLPFCRVAEEQLGGGWCSRASGRNGWLDRCTACN